jgi:hypothetical protein
MKKASQNIVGAVGLFALSCVLSHAAELEPGTNSAEKNAMPTERWKEPLQARSTVLHGKETLQLLALQRQGQGQRPKPIDGEQASRSYERYLKSFEHPIPEAFATGIDAKK